MKHDIRSRIQEAKYISYSDILLNSNLSKKILKSINVDKANKFKQDLSKIWAKSEQDIWVRFKQDLSKKIFKLTSVNRVNKSEQDLSKISEQNLSKIWARRFLS